ncbi:MAG: AhpC/TSA family protein [Prevotella sp.]|nr:AhpC/TSA family protein [Prevotella sp.]
MKRVILTMVIAVAFVAQVGAQVNYSVSGTVPDSLNGKKVYLYEEELKNYLIDSTVVRKGRFHFKGSRKEPVAARLYIGKMPYRQEFAFVLDEVPVSISLLDGKKSVKGSRRTEAMVERERLYMERQTNSKVYELKNKKDNSPFSMLAAIAALSKEEQAERQKVLAYNDSVYDDYCKKLKALMLDNVDNVVGAHCFSYLYDQIDIEEQDRILASASQEFLNTPMVVRRIASRHQDVGHTYSDFELPDIDGKTHRLSDIVGEGKYVLLDVWASWCLGCRIETPNVKEAYAKYHDKGFEVVMVSIDATREPWLKAMEKDGVKDMGYQLFDKNSVIRKIYGIGSIPCSMLINPQGKIIANDLRNNDLEDHLSKLIGE